MIWLKGFIFLVGLIFLYQAGKQLLTIAKQKQKKQHDAKAALIRCTKCQTHVPLKDIQEIDGEPHCRNCTNNPL